MTTLTRGGMVRFCMVERVPGRPPGDPPISSAHPARSASNGRPPATPAQRESPRAWRRPPGKRGVLTDRWGQDLGKGERAEAWVVNGRAVRAAARSTLRASQGSGPIPAAGCARQPTTARPTPVAPRARHAARHACAVYHRRAASDRPPRDPRIRASLLCRANVKRRLGICAK